MELNGEYTFDAPRQVIWDALMDPDVLAKILPGVERLEKVSDTEFAGVMNVRVGPVQGKFKGTVILTDLQEPEKFHMIVDGRGAAGFLKGEGDAILTETEDGKTLLVYEGSGDVGGKIASVGQRLVETTGKSIVRQGLESLDRLTQAQLQPAVADDAVVDASVTRSGATSEYAPPSEMEVALGVAKDIFEEYVPEEQRPLVLGLAGGMILLVFVWLLKQIFSD